MNNTKVWRIRLEEICWPILWPSDRTQAPSVDVTTLVKSADKKVKQWFSRHDHAKIPEMPLNAHLLKSVYGPEYTGRPFSIEPREQLMVIAKDAAATSVDSDELVRAFLALSFEPYTVPENGDEDHMRNSRRRQSNRNKIVSFVELYGCFIPFSPLGFLDSVTGIDREVDVRLISDETVRAEARFYNYVGEHTAVTREKLRSVPWPSKFVCFFDAFEAWHAAARIIERQLTSREADKLAYDLLGIMRSACIAPVQQQHEGGKVVRYGVVDGTRNGAVGARALVEYFDQRIHSLGAKERTERAKKVLHELKGINAKIERATRRAQGDTPIEPHVRSSSSFKAAPSDELRRAFQDIGQCIHEKLKDLLSDEEIQEMFDVVGEKANQYTRLNDVERDADAILADREEGARELNRLVKIKEASLKAIDEIRQSHKDEADYLQFFFVEDLGRGTVMEKMHMKSSKLAETKNSAFRLFEEFCPVSTLDPKGDAPKERGPKPQG